MRIIVASVFAVLTLAVATGCGTGKQSAVLSASDAPSREAWVTHDEFEMHISEDAPKTIQTVHVEDGKAYELRPQLATNKQKN